MVNSGTVYSVLLGIKGRKIKRVVPRESAQSLFFAIYSHGGCHPVIAPRGNKYHVFTYSHLSQICFDIVKMLY